MIVFRSAGKIERLEGPGQEVLCHSYLHLLLSSGDLSLLEDDVCGGLGVSKTAREGSSALITGRFSHVGRLVIVRPRLDVILDVQRPKSLLVS